jgi:quercetin dioxygenase-like cupin family protein
MSSDSKITTVLTVPQPDQAEYQPVPGSTSFEMVGLRGDLAKSGGTFLSRMAPGAVAPWHRHSHTEEIVVLKGTIVAQLKGKDPVRLEAGGYSQLPSEWVHRFRCTEDSECIIFVVDDGAFDLQWVDESGNEITEQMAESLAAETGTHDW